MNENCPYFTWIWEGQVPYCNEYGKVLDERETDGKDICIGCDNEYYEEEVIEEIL